MSQAKLENNSYANFCGVEEVHYGISESDTGYNKL